MKKSKAMNAKVIVRVLNARVLQFAKEQKRVKDEKFAESMLENGEEKTRCLVGMPFGQLREP